MAEFKYVVVETEGKGKQMFIFPKNVNHDEFAEVLSYITEGGRNWTRPRRKPVSAGFTDMVSCYGRSESLDLDSDPSDTELLSNSGKE